MAHRKWLESQKIQKFNFDKLLKVKSPKQSQTPMLEPQKTRRQIETSKLNISKNLKVLKSMDLETERLLPVT